MSYEVAHVPNAGEAMESQPINILSSYHSGILWFEKCSESDCNSKLIRPQQVSDACN